MLSRQGTLHEIKRVQEMRSENANENEKWKMKPVSTAQVVRRRHIPGPTGD